MRTHGEVGGIRVKFDEDTDTKLTLLAAARRKKVKNKQGREISVSWTRADMVLDLVKRGLAHDFPELAGFLQMQNNSQDQEVPRES